MRELRRFPEPTVFGIEVLFELLTSRQNWTVVEQGATANSSRLDRLHGLDNLFALVTDVVQMRPVKLATRLKTSLKPGIPDRDSTGK